MNEVFLLLRGFDVVISPSEDCDDCYKVVIYENDKQVAEYNIPIDLEMFGGDEDDVDGSEEVFEYAGEAAIDLYESERGTLGQGAGAMNKDKKQSNKKTAFLHAPEWEQWFVSLKGTAYEQQALELLENYLEVIHEVYYGVESETEKRNDLHGQEKEMYKELDNLYLERMKEVDPHQTVIVVQARKNALYTQQEYQKVIEDFEGTKWEQQALQLLSDLLEVRTQINNLNDGREVKWEQIEQLEMAMRELSLIALEDQLGDQPAIEKMPEMMEDLTELAEGVEFDEPLEPESGSILTASMDEGYEEFGSDTVNVSESGIDLAEEPIDDYLEEGQKVEIIKKLEIPMWGGSTLTINKGTKGKIDTAYDMHGTQYMVLTEEGKLIKVTKDEVKKAS